MGTSVFPWTFPVRFVSVSSIVFLITQDDYILPEGEYTFITRAKAQASDTIEMRIRNATDAGTWATAYNSPTTKILCLKTYSVDGKLYAGGDDGKIYVTSNGTDWSLAYDTGQDTVYCLEEVDGILYAGTGDTDGIIYAYDNAAWYADYDTGEIAVYSLLQYSKDEYIYAGTGSNGKIFRNVAGTWGLHWDLAETSVFALTEYSDLIFAGTGNNGKIYAFGDFPADTEYSPPASAPTGLTWDGSNIWSCDPGTAKIYKHNADMTVNTTYDSPGSYPSGLAWDGSNIWSCGYFITKIYKHNADMTVNTTYDSPSSNPSGLTWDGSNIWSCSAITAKIYKHNADMTVNTTYDSLRANPSGLTWDGSNIWSCCSASTYKIYKHKEEWYEDYDSSETYIYALKTHTDLFAGGGDNGKIFKKTGGSWSEDYASGETAVRSLFVYNDKLYAGTGANGKLLKLNGTWGLEYTSDEDYIYGGETFVSKVYVGSGDVNGKILRYTDGVLAIGQKTVTTSFGYHTLDFEIGSLDLDDEIQFKVTKDGAVATYVDVDFLCFVSK